VLPKDYARPGLDKQRLGQLIDLLTNLELGSDYGREKDLLGRVYEYFLSQFASAEGKKGGQFYTPASVVRLLVEMLAPYKGRVYDPCCGSGGMFVQSARFIEAHANGNGGKGGRPSAPTPSAPTLPPHLAALFPSRLVESELGEVPEGWEMAPIGDVTDNPRRAINPDAINPATPYIGLEHMPRRCIALTDWGYAGGLESNKFEFQRGEILFGKLRPYFHKVGVAPVDGVCSTDILVLAPKNSDWFAYVLGHVTSDEFVNHANAGSTGTKMPRTNWQDMARYEVVIPPESIATAFNEEIQSVIERITANIHASRTLAALRDALLPKLVSGELRVKDVEPFIAG
jgi:type I restriction enzyme S subunit